MALVTLARAKDHLGITVDTQNDLVLEKAEAASAIVLDCLTGRIVTLLSITRSAAVGTAIFTHTHGLAVGDELLISGAVQAEYNGTFAVATVVDPVTVTFAVSGSPASPATTLSTIRVRAKKTYTAATVPGHVQSAVLLWLTHLMEHRGDDMNGDEALWNATWRLLNRARDPAVA